MEVPNPVRVELDRARPALLHLMHNHYPGGGTPQERCGHNGLAMIHRVVGGYVARCLACHEIGPIWDSAEAARRALLEPRMSGRSNPSRNGTDRPARHPIT